jgi:hypothetical protein
LSSFLSFSRGRRAEDIVDVRLMRVEKCEERAGRTAEDVSGAMSAR